MIASAASDEGKPWDGVIDGMRFPEGEGSELSSYLWMFGNGSRKGDKSEVTPEDRFRYFKKAVDLAFNNEDSICRVEWTPWVEWIVKELIGDWSKKRFVGIAGASSCVSGDTRLLNPITGEAPTIQSLCEGNLRPWVQTLNGPVLADIPYLKGRAELYEFRLSNGETFKCTAEHRLLTASGWRYAKETTVGGEIYGYVPSHRPTTSGNGHSAREQDAHHSSQTAEGSRFGCHHALHLCDGQLLSARESAQGILPLLDDVQKYNGYASVRLDALCSEPQHNHLFRESGPSTRSVCRHKSLLETPWLSRFVSGISSLGLRLFQRHQPSPSRSAQLDTLIKSYPSSSHKQRRDIDAVLCEAFGFRPSLKHNELSSLGHGDDPQQVGCSSALEKARQSADPFPRLNALPASLAGFLDDAMTSRWPTGLSPSHGKEEERSCAVSSGQQSFGQCQELSCGSSELMVQLVQVESIENLGVHDFYDLNVPIEHHYFAEGAIHHNSGKSHTVALYGLMAYWASPTETYFITMSTTKDAARTRIWKSITQLWGQASRMGAPGKLIDSNGYIKGLSKKLELDRNSGVLLKPAGKLSDDASAELLGIKNPSVIVAADEMNHLTDGILKTAYENMTSNDRILFVGMANPDKLTDPFGQLCEPSQGWKSITEADKRWLTRYGTCIRLNAEQSPRITEPEKYGHLTWMTDQAYCDRIALGRGGVKSAGYYRFVKAFWCPDGASNTVYSELELLEACKQDEPAWDEVPVTISSLDESFSRDGDQSFAAVARLGKVGGRDHLHVCCEKAIQEDSTNKETPHTFQIARGWKKLCEDFGVKPNRGILDNTGGGTAFGHIVDMEWSPAVQKVNFQGKASDRTIVFRNEDCSFYNKNSEMWIQPKEYIRSGQITGLSRETMAEMVDREYHPKEGRTLRVESKEEARKRLKKSPDRADAFNMLVEKAVTLGSFKSEEVKKVSKMMNNGWGKARTKIQLATAFGRKLRR